MASNLLNKLIKIDFENNFQLIIKNSIKILTDFDWGCISFSKGWGSIQEWGCIDADTVYVARLHLTQPVTPYGQW